MRSGMKNKPLEDGGMSSLNSDVRIDEFEIASEWLLEAIDSVEEYGWFSE